MIYYSVLIAGDVLVVAKIVLIWPDALPVTRYCCVICSVNCVCNHFLSLTGKSHEMKHQAHRRQSPGDTTRRHITIIPQIYYTLQYYFYMYRKKQSREAQKFGDFLVFFKDSLLKKKSS